MVIQDTIMCAEDIFMFVQALWLFVTWFQVIEFTALLLIFSIFGGKCYCYYLFLLKERMLTTFPHKYPDSILN